MPGGSLLTIANMHKQEHIISASCTFSMKTDAFIILITHLTPVSHGQMVKLEPPKTPVKRIYHNVCFSFRKNVRSWMDLKQNQRKQDLRRSWPVQSYRENDVTTAADRTLIDSAQSKRNVITYCIFLSTLISPCSSLHLLNTTDCFCK